MKRIITLICALMLALTPVCALAAIDVVDYTPDFYVADYANVLSDELEGLIVLNNDQLDFSCGAQIVVVTVDTVGDATIENYAYTLFNEWGIGDKAKNNGLLILLAVQDGNYWLMTGKGLQDYITAGDLDEMANEHFIPHAATNDFETGIRQLFGACFDTVSIAYNADITVNDSLYYNWLQSGATGTDGAKFLKQPLREPVQKNDPAPVVQNDSAPSGRTEEPVREKGGFSIIPLIIIIIIVVVIIRSRRTVRARPGQHRVSPAPHRPVAPPPPPMRGPAPRPAPRPIPRPAPRPAPRPPMGTPTRPSSGSRPMGGRPSGSSFGGNRMGGGGITRGGGTGGSFSRPSGGSRPTRSGGGFGGGRTGGGGSTRGGGSGGSFRGGR